MRSTHDRGGGAKVLDSPGMVGVAEALSEDALSVARAVVLTDKAVVVVDSSNSPGSCNLSKCANGGGQSVGYKIRAPGREDLIR